jgi:hypothetical protein
MRHPTAFATPLVLATISLAIGSSALAQAGSFSFKSVEFMNADQREPAAKAFIHDNVQPGMPLKDAIHVVKKAGALCHAPKDGQVLCTHSSLQRHPGHSLTDVLWTVTITASPDGTVSNADVSRTTKG